MSEIENELTQHEHGAKPLRPGTRWCLSYAVNVVFGHECVRRDSQLEEANEPHRRDKSEHIGQHLSRPKRPIGPGVRFSHLHDVRITFRIVYELVMGEMLEPVHVRCR